MAEISYVFDIPTQRSGEFETLAGALLYAIGNRYPVFSVTQISRRKILGTSETVRISESEVQSLIETLRGGGK